MAKIDTTAEINAVRFAEQATDPDTPDSGYGLTYFKSDGKLYYIDDAGVITGPLAESGAPGAHASTHENGGSDEISVAGLSGQLADGQTPLAHASSHENAGGDEISVAGLSGLLADDQNPVAHAADHQSGGGDAIKLDDLAAPDDNTDLNASTTAHGLLKKLDNSAANFMNGQGDWATPAGAGGGVSSVVIIIDGGGSVITSGVKVAIKFYYACTLNAWAIGDPLESGSIVIDLWKDTQANFPPTDADSITNGHEPTLTTAQAAEDTDLSDWSDVTIDVGDWIIFNVDSATDVTLVTLALKVTKT